MATVLNNVEYYHVQPGEQVYTAQGPTLGVFTVAAESEDAAARLVAHKLHCKATDVEVFEAPGAVCAHCGLVGGH